MPTRPHRLLLCIAALLLAVATVGCDDGPSTAEADASDITARIDTSHTDTTPPDEDAPPTPLDALYVDFDSGSLQIVKAPFSWRFLTGGVIDAEPRSPTSAAAFDVEWVPSRGADGFDDPVPPIDQPPQAWEVVSYDQPIPRGPITLELQDPASPDTGRLTVEITPDGIGVRIVARAVPGEGFEARRLSLNWSDPRGPLLGTGMRLDNPDSRGRLRPLFLRSDPFKASGSNDALLPVPWVLNPLGYGLLIRTDLPGVFDLGFTEDAVLRARFDAQTIDATFWINPDPITILQRYAAAAGLPKAPPRWALAPQWWRTRTDAAELLLDAQTLRNYDIPAGGLWVDDPWLSAYNNFQFNPSQFPDPAQTLADLRALGLDTLVWANPFLNSSDDSDMGPGWTSGADLYAEAAGRGFLVTDSNAQPLELRWGGDRAHIGGLIDFTNPDAVTWWADRLATLSSLGVSGLRLDTSSPLLQTDVWLWAEDYRFANGQPFLTMHRRYANAAYDAAQQVFASDPDGFVLGGEGAWGAQSGLQAVWSPPLRAGFGPHTDDTLGGLEAALTAGLSLSVSGYPFYAPEAGGRVGDAPNAEALLRWAALGVVSPIMQVGGDAFSHMPWEAPYDLNTLDNLRTLAKLRIQLTRYLEAQVAAAALDGTPIMRPIPIMFPDYGEARDITDAFMLGPDLLVAPVIEEGVTERDVFIPPGLWRNWYTSALVSGPDWVRVPAPLDQIPMFVRDTALIPLRLDSVDTLRPLSDPPEGLITPTQADSTLLIRAFGFTTHTLTLPDGGSVAVDFRGGAPETNITFTSDATTRSLLVEFVGVEATGAFCDSKDIPNDPTLSARATLPDDVFAYRVLPQGTLIHFPTDGSCRLQWVKGLD
jgi:alpha-glucosidase (family GH31 glycosyl hydrolase)